MLTNQRPTRAVRLYALRFMVYGGPSNAMTVVVPRNETPKAALGTIGGGHWKAARAAHLQRIISWYGHGLTVASGSAGFDGKS